MTLIFCADPFAPTSPDEAYAKEAQAAIAAGLSYELISYEKLVHEDNPAAAVRRVTSATETELAVYRGWMLRPAAYQGLYDALLTRGLRLINTPDTYRTCHYLPKSYPFIAGHTPATVWLPLDQCNDIDRIMAALAPFGNRPMILKDYVQSRKHEWFEACFIPSAADRDAVERVVSRFLELQGDEVSEGLVFREYATFQPIGTHSRSGMPLTREYRLFFLNGTLLTAAPYWEEGADDGANPPVDVFYDVATTIPSRFFTMDVAQCTDSAWMIVELGDAQVAGLPERMDVASFYTGLRMGLEPRRS